METFSALLAICAGNSPAPVKSPHNGQWRGALMLSLICPWINDWLNNREAGDLRRHRGHYDVNVMCVQLCFSLGSDSKRNAQNQSEDSEIYGQIFMILKSKWACCDDPSFSINFLPFRYTYGKGYPVHVHRQASVPHHVTAHGHKRKCCTNIVISPNKFIYRTDLYMDCIYACVLFLVSLRPLPKMHSIQHI